MDSSVYIIKFNSKNNSKLYDVTNYMLFQRMK